MSHLENPNSPFIYKDCTSTNIVFWCALKIVILGKFIYVLAMKLSFKMRFMYLLIFENELLKYSFTNVLVLSLLLKLYALMVILEYVRA